MNHLNINQSAGAELVRGGRDLVTPTPEAFGNFLHSMGLKGHFKVEHWRNGNRIDERHFDNGITNEGKNFLLNVMFHGTSPDATWYLGLIDNSGYSALAATDTYANIDQAGNGWDEFASYTDTANAGSSSTRPEWTEGAASSQTITNSSVVVFDITGSGTVKGIFVVGGANAQTKSNHTAAASNILWSTALFSGGDSAVLNGDQLKVTYSVSA
jgi:hypothetical protein